MKELPHDRRLGPRGPNNNYVTWLASIIGLLTMIHLAHFADHDVRPPGTNGISTADWDTTRQCCGERFQSIFFWPQKKRKTAFLLKWAKKTGKKRHFTKSLFLTILLNFWACYSFHILTVSLLQCRTHLNWYMCYILTIWPLSNLARVGLQWRVKAEGTFGWNSECWHLWQLI